MRTRVVLAAVVFAAGLPLLLAGEPEAAFPAAWEGTWKGDLEVARPGAEPQTLPMTLVVAPTDSPDRWSWRIRYGGQPERPYELVIVDAAAGRYAIDEGNSIVLPSRRIGDELVGVFEVSGNRVATRYRRDGEALVVEMLVSRAATSGTTGGKDGVPEVKHYEAVSIQRAVLAR